MSDGPTPDQPVPGENDRTIVDQPTKSNLENDATIKNAPNTGEFEATIKDAAENAATGGSVPSHGKTELSVGSRFGRYELKKELGRGAMGVVYLAHDTNLDRKVALKVPSFSEDDGDDIVDRFYREARAMATIHHPNLCPVYDVAEIDGVHYLTMQFIEGRPLSDFVQGSKTHTPKQVAAVLRKLALALDAAHQAGIVHRDLKPANIMISAANEPVIMDFGLAQRRKQNETTLTQSGQLMGTPAYMSPEQVKGDQELIGPPSDVYALGVICYQLLTGKLPFTGSLGEVMAGILTAEPERPSKAGHSKVDRSIEAICLKAMARDMEDRYASAGELAQSLKDYMRGKRLPDEVALPAPTDSSPGIEPSGSVYTSRQEARLADDFFADLEREQSPASLPPRRRKKKKGNRKKKGALANINPLWLTIGGGVLLSLIIIIVIASNRGSDKNQVADQSGSETDSVSVDAKSPLPGAETTKEVSEPTNPPDVTPQPAAVVAPPLAKAPFSATQAKKHQQDWAEYLGLPIEKEVTLPDGAKLTLVLIPPGEFVAHKHSDRQSLARITKPFYLGKYEVTQSQWQSVMGVNQSTVKDSPRHPVENVTWTIVQKFLAKLNKSGSSENMTFALPTEAQWEHACRAGTTTKYSFGDSEADLPQYGWFDQNSDGKPHPVGGLKPNALGLYDMHGNVSEWCADWHAEDYYGLAKAPVDDPTGPSTGLNRLRRGGGWRSRHFELRSFSRQGNSTNVVRNDGGFRLAAVLSNSASTPTADSHGARGQLDVTPPTQIRVAPPLAIAPFDKNQALAHQHVWAKHLGVPVEYTNSIGMKFRLIPPGEFLMGIPPEELDAQLKHPKTSEGFGKQLRSEGPQHKVVITQPIYVGVTEVTQSQYEQVMRANPSDFSSAGKHKSKVANLKTGNHPVENVSWNDAAEFCAKLSQQEKLQPFYSRASERVTFLQGTGYRLPTEAEWEFACRAGTTTRYWSGEEDQSLMQAGWSYSSRAGGRTHAVGELKENPFGLWDVLGNVWEWCQDFYDEDYYKDAPLLDPTGPETGSTHTARGGSWFLSHKNCRSYSRTLTNGLTGQYSIGVRVVKALPPVVAPQGSKPAPKAPAAPFDAAAAKAHQEAWARHVGEPVVTTNSIGMQLAVIPPGKFKMGDPDKAVDVTLTKPFRIGVHEVTQGQWKAVMGMGSEPWKGKPQTIEGENVPATSVSWTNAKTFCQRLTERERAAGRLPEDRAYYLPTEAEWEWACRAGTTTAYSFGNDESQLGEYAWYDSNAKNAGEAYAHAVGLKKPNPWGLFDVHGNVWELCADWFGVALPRGTDPKGPTEGSNTIGRGGSWGYIAVGCRSAIRQGFLPSTLNINLGFRVAAVASNSASTPTADGQDAGGQPDVTPPTQARKAPQPAKAPFDKKQALAHQNAWAKHLGVKVLTTNSIGMKMRLIPPGEFLMGSSQEELQKVMAEARKRKYAESWIRDFSREGPQHRVTLTKPFRLAVHEVTRGQFRQFVVATGYQTNAEKDGKDVHGYKGGKSVQVSKHPVVNVSWNDAVAFCEWLSKKEGVTYRLPTEAQWEFACRAGSPARFSFGDNETLLKRYAWYEIDGGRSTMPVGTKAANAFALFDMHGNVWEWCNDGLVSYTAAPALDPVGPAQAGSGLLRGGAFRLPSMLVRSATRFPSTLSNASVDVGFRVAEVLSN